MQNMQRADGVNDLVRHFAERNELMNSDAETIAAKLIAAALHWSMKAAEHDGEDGRKIALAAARRGLGDFISDVHTVPSQRPPATYTLITVRTDAGLWVSETGYEEVIQ